MKIVEKDISSERKDKTNIYKYHIIKTLKMVFLNKSVLLKTKILIKNIILNNIKLRSDKKGPVTNVIGNKTNKHV